MGDTGGDLTGVCVCTCSIGKGLEGAEGIENDNPAKSVAALVLSGDRRRQAIGPGSLS